MCRSRRELSNAYLLAKIGVDTAENEPFQVCPLSVYRSPRSSSTVLLSMLGVAAGDETRRWLRENGIGLKQLLQKHSDVFQIDGEKGKQAVTLVQPPIPCPHVEAAGVDGFEDAGASLAAPLAAPLGAPLGVDLSDWTKPKFPPRLEVRHRKTTISPTNI